MDRSARRLSDWLVAALLVSLLAAVGAPGADAATGDSDWPTPDGPQGTNQQTAAEGPVHPGVRWSTPTHDAEGQPVTDGWLPEQNGFAMLDGVGHVLFEAKDANATEEALAAFDTTTGAFRWASQELLLDQGDGCHLVAASDGTVWGVGEVPSRYPHFTTDTKHALRALDPSTGAITRTWRPEGNMLCTTVDLTAEGLLVARVTEDREVDDPVWGTALETFYYVVGIDPLTGAERWRYTPSDAACTLGEVRGVAPAGGPANTIYVDLGWCGTNEQGKLAALDTTTGTERTTLDRAMPEGQLDVLFFAAGTLLGYEDSDDGSGSWLVAVRDNGSTLSVKWRIAIAGPDDTSGDEPQTGACLSDVCRFGHVMGAPDGTVMVYGHVLKAGVSTAGFARVDLIDGNVRWTRSLTELGVIPATTNLSTDRTGRLWFVPADDDFDPDNDYQKVVSLSADGVLSHDTDGDGIVEHGLGAPRYYTLVPTYSGNGDPTDYDGDGKPEYAPDITPHYVSALDADGNLYGIAYGFNSNTGASTGYFFSLADVAPGDDRLDGSTGGGGPGGDTGGDTGGGSGGGGTTDDPRVTRYDGLNRYQTSAMTVRNTFDPGVAKVYVATGENFPDALAAAAAAGRDGGPVVLVRPDRVPSEVASVLDYLAPGSITVVGGPTAVSDEVVVQLGNHTSGRVDRVEGDNRYETAAKLGATFTGQPTVYIATGTNFPDALAGTVPAILWQGPILLVTRDAIPTETAAVLERLRPSGITVLGGDAVISEAVERQLGRFTNGPVRRLAGDDRYETAVEISQDRMGGAPRIYVATGGNFPDALAGGAPAGLESAAMLLVPSTGTVPTVVLDEISRLRAGHLVVLGGEGAVSPEVVDQLVTRVGG